MQKKAQTDLDQGFTAFEMRFGYDEQRADFGRRARLQPVRLKRLRSRTPTLVHNDHPTVSTLASPMSEYFPTFDVEVGNELFHDVVDGEPVAENGFLQPDDDEPGLGSKLKTEFVDPSEITE